MQIDPIATVKSHYKEKFGTPRQSGLVHSDRTEILFRPSFCFEEFTRGLENISHVWVIFSFHLVKYKTGQTTVRPPRLGGKERIGIFACRTPHRPNQLGLSLVKIKEIKNDRIVVNGADLVDGTPIFDIKPYHPQADRPSDFNSGYISELNREKLKVTWSCPKPSESAHIEDVLSQDPRPSYHRHTYQNREYGLSLHNLNIKFVIRGHEICILETQLTKK